jgi:hypothetical protein
MVRCKYCGIKSRTNYNHGVNGGSTTSLEHDFSCREKNYNKVNAKKNKRRG